MEDQTEEVVRTVLADLLAAPHLKETLNMSDSLHTIGVNSVMFVKLVVEVERRLNVYFEDDELSVNRFSTLGQMVRMISERRGEQNGYDH